jgi:hypothetical protein
MVALARRQDGVLEITQLRSLGFSDDRVGLLVEQGRFVRRHRGVYADALVTPTPRARLLGALLALGDSAFLSRRTALALHGVRPLDLHRIEVTIVAGRTPSRKGLVVHRTSIEPLPQEVCTRDGLRCSSASLALLESSARESDRELDRLIAELARRRQLHLEWIDRAIEQRKGLPGVRRLREALGRYRPPTAHDASTLERDFAAWLSTHPEIPSPQRNVRLGPWELDFLWSQQRLVVETDGAQYHLTPAELERDRVKDAWLQRRNLRVLRVTGFRFAHDRPGILGDICGLLHAA